MTAVPVQRHAWRAVPCPRCHAQPGARDSTGDGWFAAAALPLAGEWTVPLTDAASFEFEARPKGVFVESFRRWGLTTLGGHTFVGDRRRLATVVATHNVTPRVSVLAGVGLFNAAAATDTRFSLGGEMTLSRLLVAGLRVDHRTEQGLDPVVLLYGNGHPCHSARRRFDRRCAFKSSSECSPAIT